VNIQKAKSIARIPAHVSVCGKAGAERALAYCKSEIISARKADNDARAAELSEAKEFFKRRQGSRSFCAGCGVVINRGAERCTICANDRGRKILPPLDGTPARRKKASRRIDVSPEGGWLARYGFYAGPVQKVVKKWSGKVTAGRIQHYFAKLAEGMIARRKPWAFDYVGPNDWQCLFELGLALDSVLRDHTKPESWLIRNPIWVATDGAQDDWAELSRRSAFKPNTLNQAARRLRMITPKRVQESYRRALSTL